MNKYLEKIAKNMNKYLEKIAKTTEEERQSSLRQSLGALNFFTPGTSAAGVTGAILAHKPIVSEVTRTDFPIHKPTLKKILKHENLNVTKSPNKAYKGNINPDHMNEVRKIESLLLLRRQPGMSKHLVDMKGSKNMGVLAHELGHAKAINKGHYQTTNPKHVVAGSMGGEIVGNLMLLSPHTSGLAWTAPILGSAPDLVSEGVANYHGYDMLKRHGGKEMANKFLKRIASKNMLNYAGRGLGQAAYLYGMHKLFKHIDPRSYKDE